MHLNEKFVWWRLLVLLLALSSIIIFIPILLILLNGTHSDLIEVRLKRSEENKDYCETKVCLTASKKIQQHLDQTINPCDNFYQFSCGSFVRNAYIPEDKSMLTIFTQISDILDVQLKSVLEEPIKNGDPKSFKLIKDYYNGCINDSRIEELGLKVILDLLKDLGGWPVLEPQWNPINFTWFDLLYNYRKRGIDPNVFIKFGLDIHPTNSTKRIIAVNQPTFGLDRDFLVLGRKNKWVKSYYEYMVKTAIHLGAQELIAVKEMEEVLEFEIKLAHQAWSLEQRSHLELLFNLMTIKEAQLHFPTIPWLQLLNSLSSPYQTVDKNEEINIYVPSYIRGFEKIIIQTPKRVQSNYALWHLVQRSAAHSTTFLRNLQFKYHSFQSGVLKRLPRWKECIDQTNQRFKHLVGSLYVRRYFSPDAKQDALLMVKYLLDEFQIIINDTDWMDSETKEKALEKTAAIEPIIGYADQLLDNQKLDDLYANLTISSQEYFQSTLLIQKFLIDVDYLRFREPINASDWIEQINPAVVNAYFLFQENSIKFPAGILQGLLFDKDRPKYMNYGAIGSVIGHEITHAFDDKGNLFDKNGNFIDWWAPNTTKTFLEKTKCMSDQYGSYIVQEINQNVNGLLTQGENIADNGGLKGAYRAYQNFVTINGPELKLPELNYTPNQLFWISYALNWCTAYRLEVLETLIATDTHTLATFRVNGPVSNSYDFSKDFNCPVGSNMNPVHKCSVW